MEPDVRRTLTLIHAEEAEETDASAHAADAWLAGLMVEGRYALDVCVA